jgi:Family of unknown function (DUF5684)
VGEYQPADYAIAAALATLITLVLLGVPTLAGLWKVFEKSGRPGWAALVPVWNIAVLHRIAGHPGWWAWLYLVPCAWPVVVVPSVLALLDLAKCFGKDALFGLGLVAAPFVTLPILGFGPAKYEPPPVEVHPVRSDPL